MDLLIKCLKKKLKLPDFIAVSISFINAALVLYLKGRKTSVIVFVV